MFCSHYPLLCARQKSSGGGLLMFVYAVVAKNKDEKYAGTLQLLGRIVVALLLFDLMLEFAEFSIPMWYGIGSEYALMTEILFGHFWWVFWIVHIVVGSAIPIFLILIFGDKPWANALAGFLIATMFLAVRLNIVIPGLIEPSLKLLESSFTDRRLKFEYLPSFFEWQVLIFIVALGIALFFLWDYFGVTSDLPAQVESLGLNSRTWIPFIAYFALVNPFIEEYFWRGFLGSLSSNFHVSDLLYSGFHALILIGRVRSGSILFAFIVLALAGWFWRQIVRADGGLLAPVLGHMAADLTILVTVCAMTT